jgi:hypothetical protein
MDADQRGFEERMKPEQPTVGEVGAVKPAECPVKNPWVRRIGAAGFVFFLVKGWMWTAVPAGVAVWRWVGTR